MSTQSIIKLRDAWKRAQLTPKKQFGQHYLIDENVIASIISAVEPGSSILEVGPGPGSITFPLFELAPAYTAIEIDPRFSSFLTGILPNLQLIQADVLTVDLNPVLTKLPPPRSVVSNMPYNITGPLLEKIRKSKSEWDSAVLMMQKEVGDKLIAAPRNSERGAVSVIFQEEFQIDTVVVVGPNSFEPPPKVTSIVLKLTPHKHSVDEGYAAFLRAAFKQPRKTLLNNLIGIDGVSAEIGRVAIEALGFPASVRPHFLSSEHWHQLYSAVQPQTH